MYQKHMKHNWKHKKIYKHFQKIEQNCNSLFKNFLEALKDTRKIEFAKSSKTQYFPMFYQVFHLSSIFFCEKMSSSSTLPVCFLHLAPLFSLESFRLLKSKLKTKQTPLKAFKDTTKKNESAKSSKTQYFPMFYQVFHLSSIFFCEKMSSSSTLPVCFLHLALLFL